MTLYCFVNVVNIILNCQSVSLSLSHADGIDSHSDLICLLFISVMRTTNCSLTTMEVTTGSQRHRARARVKLEKVRIGKHTGNTHLYLQNKSAIQLTKVNDANRK